VGQLGLKLMISPLCCNNVPAPGFHSFWRVV
jgi:hypothetical protein